MKTSTKLMRIMILITFSLLLSACWYGLYTVKISYSFAMKDTPNNREFASEFEHTVIGSDIVIKNVLTQTKNSSFRIEGDELDDIIDFYPSFDGALSLLVDDGNAVSGKHDEKIKTENGNYYDCQLSEFFSNSNLEIDLQDYDEQSRTSSTVSLFSGWLQPNEDFVNSKLFRADCRQNSPFIESVSEFRLLVDNQNPDSLELITSFDRNVSLEVQLSISDEIAIRNTDNVNLNAIKSVIAEDVRLFVALDQDGEIIQKVLTRPEVNGNSLRFRLPLNPGDRGNITFDPIYALHFGLKAKAFVIDPSQFVLPALAGRDSLSFDVDDGQFIKLNTLALREAATTSRNSLKKHLVVKQVGNNSESLINAIIVNASFSETVTGFDASDINVDFTGTLSGDVSVFPAPKFGVSDSSTTTTRYSIALNNLAGDGSLSITPSEELTWTNNRNSMPLYTAGPFGLNVNYSKPEITSSTVEESLIQIGTSNELNVLHRFTFDVNVPIFEPNEPDFTVSTVDRAGNNVDTVMPLSTDIRLENDNRVILDVIYPLSKQNVKPLVSWSGVIVGLSGLRNTDDSGSISSTQPYITSITVPRNNNDRGNTSFDINVSEPLMGELSAYLQCCELSIGDNATTNTDLTGRVERISGGARLIFDTSSLDTNTTLTLREKLGQIDDLTDSESLPLILLNYHQQQVLVDNQAPTISLSAGDSASVSSQDGASELGQGILFEVQLSEQSSLNLSNVFDSFSILSPSGSAITNDQIYVYQEPEQANTFFIFVSVEDANGNVVNGEYTLNIVEAGAIVDQANNPVSTLSNLSVASSIGQSVGWDVQSSNLVLTEPSANASNIDDLGQTISLALSSEPSGNVSVLLSTSDSANISFNADNNASTETTAALMFTATNWDTPQLVTVYPVRDFIAQGSVSAAVAVSIVVSNTDDNTGYADLSATSIPITVNDSDLSGLVLGDTSGQASESGGSSTFDLLLRSKPIGNVIVDVTSSDTTEIIVSPASLTYTPSNWNVGQTITATGVNDDLADGEASSVISLSINSQSTDTTGYQELASITRSVSNSDNDTVGIQLGDVSGQATESGGVATMNVRLNTEPTGNVLVDITSSDTGEIAVSPSRLTFTPQNWASAQSITATGVDDDLTDGNASATVSFSVNSQSNDTSGYLSLSTQTRSFTNSDNDTASLQISEVTAGLSDSGGTSTVTVQLTSMPSSPVTVTLSYADNTEFTVSPSNELVFNSSNWDQAQTVTFTGISDGIQDGNIDTVVTFSATEAGSNGYSDVPSITRTLRSIDNDATPGFIVSAVSGNTTEDGGTATVTIRLAVEPSGDVQFFFDFYDAEGNLDLTEGSVMNSSLSFDTSNWDTPQTITVTGEDDSEIDGDVEYFMEGQDSGSFASEYSDVTFRVRFVNEDNDE